MIPVRSIPWTLTVLILERLPRTMLIADLGKSRIRASNLTKAMFAASSTGAAVKVTFNIPSTTPTTAERDDRGMTFTEKVTLSPFCCSSSKSTRNQSIQKNERTTPIYSSCFSIMRWVTALLRRSCPFRQEPSIRASRNAASACWCTFGGFGFTASHARFSIRLSLSSSLSFIYGFAGNNGAPFNYYYTSKTAHAKRLSSARALAPQRLPYPSLAKTYWSYYQRPCVRSLQFIREGAVFVKKSPGNGRALNKEAADRESPG